MFYRRVLLALLLGCLPLAAVATAESYDRITLAVTASDQVDNDTLVALLYYQSQGRDTAQVAERLNRAIAWGLERSRRESGIKVQTLDYQTSPVYENGKLTGIWRVRQSLRLESRDTTLLSGLLGELQEKLAIQHIGYRLSDDSRRRAEDGLIRTAIARFKQKAQLVAEQFEAADYRIVSLDISSSGTPVRPLAMRYAMDGVQQARMASAPELEAGEQRVSIGISGVIELVRE